MNNGVNIKQEPPGQRRLYLRDPELDQGAALIASAAARLQRIAADARPAALAEPLALLLLDIALHGPCDIKTLGAQTARPRPTLARQLADLDQRALIEKTAGGADQRTRTLTLSETGARVVAPMLAAIRKRMVEAYRAQTPDGVSASDEILRSVAGSAQTPLGRP